jgi:hypothetical protein
VRFTGLVVTGIWQFAGKQWPEFSNTMAAIPIFLYLKNEFILLAFLKLRKQDFP